MTENLTARAMGTDRRREDGIAKVTGRAPYAHEHGTHAPCYLAPLRSTIARGRVRGIDAAAVRRPGVLAVLTHENAPPAPGEDAELAILQSPEVHFRGQLIGAVLAESPEVARHAAAEIPVRYEQDEHDAHFAPDRTDLRAPTDVTPSSPADAETGDPDGALATAPITVDATYRTPPEFNNPMEPHATVAVRDGAKLTLHDSTQGVHPVRETVARVLGIDPDDIHVVCPHVGGGFGCKGLPHANVVLAAMATWLVEEHRPVKYAVSRQEMFGLTGYRSPTVQRLRLGADREGRLSVIVHDSVEQTARIKEFSEQSAVSTRSVYAAPHRRTTHRLAALDVPVPSWMRAPGECPGMFAGEVAVDELATACGLDPVELRVRNDTAVDPSTGKPFSSRNLVACLRRGAERFGWYGRDPAPGTRREGDWLIGTGVAASMYPTHRIPGSTAAITRTPEGYLVRIGAVDLGTGAWTSLRQIAADALGVDVEVVELHIGDTALPFATVAGGSSGTTSWGTAVAAAAEEFRERYGSDPPEGAEAAASAAGNPDKRQHAMSAFGAQFAEARVHARTGQVRVPRMLGVFAAGRIVNPRTARSQFLGGMVMGVSMALHEEGVLDARFGHVVNRDFAQYHVAANADVGDIGAEWLDEEDPHVNPMGSKGIGEIGIVGAPAAVLNATYHATGRRVRDLPLTPDKFLP
ncbi:xanthine dehydrogenase family protein molybdopterin-binding subunit [Salinifilum aidingensis]